jgi:hypothetical protein
MYTVKKTGPKIKRKDVILSARVMGLSMKAGEKPVNSFKYRRRNKSLKIVTS